MTHEINKEKIFKFLKEKSIIKEVATDKDIIVEENSKGAKLKKVTFSSLNKSSKYWIFNTESAFQPQGRKVEKIILEQQEDGILNIIMIELKSEKVGNQNKILEKFKNSLSWIYILLNLLDGKQGQKIRVFGILISQDNSIEWKKKDKLNLFSSTSIRYVKRSFYTTDSEMNMKINRVKEEICN